MPISDEMVKAADEAWLRCESCDPLIAMRAALEAAEAVREREVVSVRSRKHAFEPDPKYPWFCAKCGYGPSTDLMHLASSGGNRG